MAPPIRARPRFPHSQSLPSGSFHKPLILIHQRTDRMKTTVTAQLFASPLITVHQASLFFTISQSLLKLMSVELMMPSNHLVLCCSLLLLPSIFPSIMSQLSASGGQSTGASASASVPPINIQDTFPFGLIGLISLLSKGLSRVFSDTTVQNSSALSFLYGPALHPYMITGKTIDLTRRTFFSKVMSLLFNMLSMFIIALTRQTFVSKVMSLLFNMLLRLVIAFLPRSKHVLISWLQSPSVVFSSPRK